MNVPERLKPFTQSPLRVLDDGHVQLLDVMGDDLAIVDAARVSFFGTASEHTDKQNRHLVRYLMRSRHSTPFEMCELKVRVRVPMDTWRQWIRHRTASVNESSTRYAPAIDSAQKVTEWRAQSKDNKQGSSGLVEEWPNDYLDGLQEWEGTDNYDSPADYLSRRETAAQNFAREVYEERLAFGVAREVARKDLPLSTYTEAVWKMDLHNLFHFLGLRLAPDAQKEIRAYAEAIAEIVKVWVPWAWEAFEDYRLRGMHLSRQEVEGLRALLAEYKKDKGDLWAEHGYGLGNPAVPQLLHDRLMSIATDGASVKGREKRDFTTKMGRLLSGPE
jgi:thymidylate synthase (FAD)